MTSTKQRSAQAKVIDPDWDKTHALKVSRNRMIGLFAVYGIWLAFLAYLAANRWLGSLQ